MAVTVRRPGASTQPVSKVVKMAKLGRENTAVVSPTSFSQAALATSSRRCRTLGPPALAARGLPTDPRWLIADRQR